MRSFLTPTRIAIDGNEANTVNRVGSNIYAYEILRQLEVITRTTRKCYHITILLSAPPVGDMPTARPGFDYRVVGPAFGWTQLALPLYLFVHRQDFEVFFTPGHYAPRFCSLPYVSSVMDLAFLHFPNQFRPRDLYQLTHWTAYSVKRAAAIVTISQFSKKAIGQIYGVASDKILVAPPGLSQTLQPVGQAKVRELLNCLGVGKNFFFYLGTLQPRKNLVRLVEAFEIFSFQVDEEKKTPVQLVLAGKKGWLTGELEEKVEQSPFRDRIIMAGFVSEESKRALLQASLANFNLGLHEGFGIPALEALSMGTLPVVASTSSLPEVVGSCGLQVDPNQTEDIAAIMQEIVTHRDKIKEKLLANRAAQLAKFTYEKSANQILSLLARIAKK